MTSLFEVKPESPLARLPATKRLIVHMRTSAALEEAKRHLTSLDVPWAVSSHEAYCRAVLIPRSAERHLDGFPIITPRA